VAQRVATRAGVEEDQRLVALSNTIDALAARISEHDTADNQRELEARAREADLDSRISSEADEWRRSKRTIEAGMAHLRHDLAVADERTALLEREMLRLRAENSELIEVLEGLFGSLASRTDLESLQQELEHSGRQSVTSIAGLTEDISSVRVVVEEHTDSMKSFVSRTDVQSLHDVLEQSVASELDARYVELRDRVEESRVTAEKAADRADYASDGVAVVQADLEGELAELKERLRNAPSEADLRAEFAVVARKEVRSQAEQLAAIRSELDHRLANGPSQVGAATKNLRRWQQWIDLPEREIGS
jgi:chromosome segregation ATPase